MPQVTLKDGKLVDLIRNSEDQWKKDLRRLGIVGPPHSGKTTSFLTFPEPRDIIICPGELGHSSIIETETTRKYWWELDKKLDRDEATKLVHQVTLKITQLVQQPKLNLLGFDGLHVLQHLVLLKHGWPNDTNMFGDKAYGKGDSLARAEMKDLIKLMTMSKAEYVVCTMYDHEGIGGETKPAMRGQMADDIMGEFPCIFHSEVVSDGTTSIYNWRLKQLGKMRAAGIHMPKEIKDKFPAVVKADWKEIERLIDGAAVASRKQL